MNRESRKLVRILAIAVAALFGAIVVLTASHPFATIPASAQESSGAQLFARNCARCHGADAKGGTGPNLTSEKRQSHWRDSNQKLVAKISKGGFIMPSFKKKLTPAQITAIADHVRSLRP